MPKTRLQLKSESSALIAQSKRLATDFLLIDAEVSITFAQLALSGHSAEKRQRNVKNARTGYDAIQYFRERLDLPESAHRTIEARLRILKSLLKKAGETFPAASAALFLGLWCVVGHF